MTGSGTSRSRQALLVATVVAALAVLTHAAAPTFWRVSTQDEFLRGEVDNITVDGNGQLRLGPVSETLHESTAPFLWSVRRAHEASDAVLWIGTGSEGQLIRVGPGDAAEIVFDSDAQNIHAVAPVDAAAAYVGTSPDGAVFRVSEGQATSVFDPDDTYIWDILRAADGSLYVATGAQGRIYRVTPDGEATLFYDTRAGHVLDLALDRDGNLLASTGSPGRVFRIAPDGRAFVVLDAPFTEVRALHLADDGAVYAAALNPAPNSQPTSSATSSSTPTPSVSTSTTVTAVVVADATPTTSASAPASSGGTTPSGTAGAVYRISPDGVWDMVWQSAADTPYDVVTDADGALIVGTGPSGKIFRVTETPRQLVLLTRAPAQQVTSFVSGPDGETYYVTSNPGKVVRLGAGRATRGSYLSEVRDATTVATWGTVRWRAQTPDDAVVRVSTRSGNTATPDETWSPWSEAYTNAEGSAITSPKARYVQWRAELEGTRATPTLISVTTAYLPRNLRPEITSLTVHEPGIVFQSPFSSGDPPIAGLDDGLEPPGTSDPATANGGTQQTTLGRRVYRKGLRTFVWTATDQNQDELRFDVEYRAEGSLTWHTLRTGLSDMIFTWDTTSIPDGTYILRVQATDRPSNAPGFALEGSVESTPFDIDNSAPRITVDPGRAEGNRTIVPFVVTDSHSPVQHVEYSLDHEHWQLIYPVDGIPDSREERFSIAVDTTDTRVVIRATDAMNNTATVVRP